ncbi:MAG: lipoyl(octanoyl) transferase LipB [Pseudomonadales bacterium]
MRARENGALMDGDCRERIVVRFLDTDEYDSTLAAMRGFTDARTSETVDEIWILQHPPVFTQGHAGKPEHVINAGDIPVIQSDRGGQITYHGPGQLVVYLLIDIRRKGLGIRKLVEGIETSVIALLDSYGIEGHSQKGAPGVYAGEAKVASLGLRIRKGCSYHGLALNVDMDLEPFSRINPCGYAGLQVTQLRDLGVADDLAEVQKRLFSLLTRQFGYHDVSEIKSGRQ